MANSERQQPVPLSDTWIHTTVGNCNDMEAEPLLIVGSRNQQNRAVQRAARSHAARASAAQSKVTRARNRDERIAWAVRSARSLEEPVLQLAPAKILRTQERRSRKSTSPLNTWLHLLLVSTAYPRQERFPTSIALARHQSRNKQPPGTWSTLPLALPRGFSLLQQKGCISGPLVNVLSRASCFDFLSQGVETRLHRLLFDLLLDHSSEGVSPASLAGHSVHRLIRITCAAVVIMQFRLTRGTSHSSDERYREGLEAIWAESVSFNKIVLTEIHFTEVLFWALVVICVTSEPSSNFFDTFLNDLADDLNYGTWEQARGNLVEFIYPSYYLDTACKDFFLRLRKTAHSESG